MSSNHPQAPPATSKQSQPEAKSKTKAPAKGGAGTEAKSSAASSKRSAKVRKASDLVPVPNSPARPSMSARGKTLAELLGPDDGNPAKFGAAGKSRPARSLQELLGEDPATCNATQQKTEFEETMAATEEDLAAAFDLLTNTDGSYCIRDAASYLGVRENDLIDYLVKIKWIYLRKKRGISLEYNKPHAYCKHLRLRGKNGNKTGTGYLVVVLCEDEETGRWPCQVRITEKGRARLARLLEKDKDQK